MSGAFVSDDGAVTSPSSEPATVPEPQAAAAAPSRYALGSVPNMIRSLVVILALVALVILMVPRVNSLSGPPVDVRARGLEVAASTGWPVVMPVGLPKGWQPTSVRYVKTTDGAMTWLAGYQAPSGNYISVEQTKDASSAWIESEVNRATKLGTVSIDGKGWVKYERGSKTQNSLVHTGENPGDLTTLVTGTGTFEEMTEFIGHLAPITP